MSLVIAHLDAARRVAGGLDRFLDPLRDPAEIFTNYIGRDGHDATLVDSVIFLGHRTVGHFGDVAQQGGRAAARFA